jgi:pimeloyl-ACP methyl ester carboxylesterase
MSKPAWLTSALIGGLGVAAFAQAQPVATNTAPTRGPAAFAPRATPTPGAETALKHLLVTVASGEPDYTSMTPQMASQVRPQLAQVHDLLSKLGPVTAMTFQEFDGANDVYDVTFAASTWRWTVGLAPDGKLASSGTLGPVSPPDPTLAPYASTKDSVRLPDGRTIHMVCMGQGTPLVILTPGGNDYASVWNKVQPVVAVKTRVCAWERAGSGLSSPSPKPQTVAETTTDLQAALKAGSFAGPYVMVGHSRGAYETLLMKDREPSSVVGMVLVDPDPPGFLAERDRLAPAVGKLDRANPDPAFTRLKACAATLRDGTVRRGGPDPNGCLALPRYPTNWPRELRMAMEQRFAGLTPAGLAADLDTRAAQFDPDFGDRDSQASTKVGRNYGSMPLVVLTAGDETPPPPNLKLPADVAAGFKLSDAQFRRDHAVLAALSTRGVHRTVAGTTHMIPQIKPLTVVDAIDEVVDEARESTGNQARR